MTREQFLDYLRDALDDLHDPDRLCRSPLARLFGVAGRFDTYAALQRILTDAITSLEPGSGVPATSRAWRIYDLLSCRYIQELSVPAVANQLGVSMRHLRREQRAALEALAFRLWEQFDLGAQAGEESGAGPEERSSERPGGRPLDDLAWLREAPLDHPIDLAGALVTVLELVRPLAAQHGVRLESDAPDPLPQVAAHPVALEQALLNLLTVAVHRAGGQTVVVTARPRRWAAEVAVGCGRPSRGALSAGALPADDNDLAGLQVAQQLAELCGGTLRLSAQNEPFAAAVTFPAFEQLPVLAVDDNADTLHLLADYAAGTRYRVYGTRDPEQAIALAESLAAQVLVLDVMMPQVDGWRLLGRLRQHPATGTLPIIICTILPQEDLALALGATGFLRKPVTQQAFLAALDHALGPAGSGSR